MSQEIRWYCGSYENMNHLLSFYEIRTIFDGQDPSLPNSMLGLDANLDYGFLGTFGNNIIFRYHRPYPTQVSHL